MKSNNTPNIKTSLSEYFKGVRFEWGKITWPDKTQVRVETIFVLIIVFVFTLAIVAIDFIFNSVLGLIK